MRRGKTAGVAAAVPAGAVKSVTLRLCCDWGAYGPSVKLWIDSLLTVF